MFKNHKILRLALLFLTFSISVICFLLWLMNHDFNFSLPKTVVKVHLPQAIDDDGTYIYWSTRGSLDENGLWNDDMADGKIMRAHTDGSSVETLASGLYSPWDIAVDDTNLYWVSVGGTYRMRKDGRDVVLIDQIPYYDNMGVNGSISGDIEVDDRNVYWINYGSLKIMDKNSGAVQEFDFGQVYWDIEINSSYIYGLDSNGDQTFLWRMSKDGTGLTRKYLQNGAINSFAIDGTNIYWGVQLCHSDNSGNVMKVSFNKETPVVLASKWNCTSGPVDLVADKDYLYWNTNYGSFNNLMSLPKEGGRPHVLAYNVFVGDIAVGSTGVFITLPFEHKVIFIAKD